MNALRHVYRIQSPRDPLPRAVPLQLSPRGGQEAEAVVVAAHVRPIASLYDLDAALSLHQGPGHAPAPAARADYATRLLRGDEMVHVCLDVLPAMRGAGTPCVTDPAPGSLLAQANRLSDLLGLPIDDSAAYVAAASGLLATAPPPPGKRIGPVVVASPDGAPDPMLRAWCARVGRWLYPRAVWAGQSVEGGEAAIRAAAMAGRFPMRQDGRVFAGLDFLLWAIEHRGA